MANEYEVGDAVRCAGAFANIAGTAVDPENIHFQHRDPAGNITSLKYLLDVAVVKDSTGNYHVDVDADEAGDWWYRFYGLANDGSFQGADETPFRTVQSRFV